MNSCPPADSKVYFAAATAFAERINVKKKRIQLTKAHRGYMATLDNGYILIDRKWYS
ncbi:MAG: hypothetical protein ACETVQ_00840 [Candidatus Bathyarchaeia archaeon]